MPKKYALETPVMPFIQGPCPILCVSEGALKAFAGTVDVSLAFPLPHSAATYRIGNSLGYVCLVVINTAEMSDGIAIAGVLVHEAVHVWQYFCEDIGEENPSVEFEAYSIQAIAQALMRDYARQTKNGK